MNVQSSCFDQSLLGKRFRTSWSSCSRSNVRAITRLETFATQAILITKSIDAIKFERTQIHFLVMFSLPLSSSLLKVKG